MRIDRRQFLRTAPALFATALHHGTALKALAANVSAPSAIATEIAMTNGAAAAGLDFVLRNDATGHKYQVETVLGGLGVIDFDGDGWPDLF